MIGKWQWFNKDKKLTVTAQFDTTTQLVSEYFDMKVQREIIDIMAKKYVQANYKELVKKISYTKLASSITEEVAKEFIIKVLNK
jgi:Na+-transporting NADH:ubiquinone oxidoreductase subunit NqrC